MPLLAPHRISALAGGRRVGNPRPRPPLSGMPLEESPRRRLFVRGVAVSAVLATFIYLTWRVMETVPSGAALWVGIPFLALELIGAVTLVLFVIATWDVRPIRVPAQVGPAPSVTVMIATYNEHIDVLLPTVRACLAMEGDHETWVLDDGDRIEVEEMVTALGARYIARPTHDYAKAGNLNHALRLCRSDLIAVFDADHVPEPTFLARTVPYFADQRVALVQTPQEFYNRSSFEHLHPGSELHEESLFYRVIQPGKNRAGAAFWCGTNAVLRTEALREVGGVATETLTEDFHTTMRLHRSGWRSVYHNEVLARGLAAGSPEAFYAQRRRWGRGAMQVLKVDNPLTTRGLTLGQRLGYAYSLSAWFEGWRTLGLILIPAAVVFTGLYPVEAPPEQFVALAGTSFVLQQLANSLLGRGFSTIRHTLLFDIIRMPSSLIATLSLLLPGTGRFVVTAKGRTGDERRRAPVPRLILVLGVLVAGALVYAVLSLLDMTPTRHPVGPLAAIPIIWLVTTLCFIIAAVRRIRDRSYATERRDGHRFPAANPVLVGDDFGKLVDVSLSGAQVTIHGREFAVGTTLELAVYVPNRRQAIRLTAVVRSRHEDNHRVQFTGRQWEQLAALSATAFAAGSARQAEEARLRAVLPRQSDGSRRYAESAVA